MFRTVIVNSGEKLSVRENWLVVSSEGEERRIPVEDIYSVVIDNQQTLVTVPSITALTEAGAHILVCNNKHMPVTVILPHNIHYRPLNVVRKQINMLPEFKDAVWKEIVKAKLLNQARILDIRHVNPEKAERIRSLADEVVDGDEGNREGIGAKMYFRALFGTDFIRMNDDGINSALNYGYAIIRSAVSKTLVAYGYNCVIGIHHINESNPFNLADDLMEPLRPIVDLWVDESHEDLLEKLTKQQRNELVDLVNSIVICEKKKMRVRNAIDRYISSFTTAIEKGNPRLIKFPVIIKKNGVFEDEGDDE
jgi:CRISPR-associated protein Cas1